MSNGSSMSLPAPPSPTGSTTGEPQKVMVYDLGGGTFDVSVIEIGEGVIEVRLLPETTTWAVMILTNASPRWLLRRFKDEHKVDLSRDFAAMQRIRDAAEQAKKRSCPFPTVLISCSLTLRNTRGEQLHMDLTLTRAQFEDLIRDLIDRTAEPVQKRPE